jgi:hypothetical protein
MIKKSIHLAIQEYIGWFFNSKILLIPFFIVFSIESVIAPMCKLAVQYGYRINLVEPFLLLTSKGLNVIILPIAFMMVLSEFPSSKSSLKFSMFRMSRLSWLLGELMFFITSYLTYIASIFVCSVVYCVSNAYVNNGWSDYTLNFYRDYPKAYEENISYFLGSELYTQMSPNQALIHSLMLMFLHIVMMSLILILFKLLNLKSLGSIAVVGLISITGVSAGFKVSSIMWLFPMTHSVLSWHYNEFLLKPNCNLSTSYCYFAIGILALFIIDLCLLKKSNLGSE